jgi:hypothetical protein
MADGAWEQGDYKEDVVERSGVVVLQGHSWLKSGVHGGGRSEGEGN